MNGDGTHEEDIYEKVVGNFEDMYGRGQLPLDKLLGGEFFELVNSDVGDMYFPPLLVLDQVPVLFELLLDHGVLSVPL